MESIKEFLKPELIWFLMGVILLVMEFVMPGLIIAFFGVGACVVAVVCLFTDISLNAQLIIFIGSSVLSLLCLRRWLKGIFIGHTKSKQDLTEDLRAPLVSYAPVAQKVIEALTGKVFRQQIRFPHKRLFTLLDISQWSWCGNIKHPKAMAPQPAPPGT